MFGKKMNKLVIISILFITSCADNQLVVSDYCDVASEIRYTEAEVDHWTEDHLRDVDNANERYRELCQ